MSRKPRTTCEKCRRNNGPLYCLRIRRTTRVRFAQSVDEIPQAKLNARRLWCLPCTDREIARRNRIDHMSAGAVGFVLANKGRI